MLRGRIANDYERAQALRDGQGKGSLYNRPGHEHIDHSVIAVAHGGGGHKGACGFSLTLGQAIMEGIVC